MNMASVSQIKFSLVHEHRDISLIWEHGSNHVLLKFNFVCLNFLYIFLDRFNILMLKIIFLKIKKYYFNIFLNKTHFKPKLHSNSQIHFKKATYSQIHFKKAT
jgi:hypothetical protein